MTLGGQYYFKMVICDASGSQYRGDRRLGKGISFLTIPNTKTKQEKKDLAARWLSNIWTVKNYIFSSSQFVMNILKNLCFEAEP